MSNLSRASVMINYQGQVVLGSTACYLPFASWRRQPTTDLTDMGFTGHKSNNVGNNDIGLIYINGRFMHLVYPVS